MRIVNVIFINMEKEVEEKKCECLCHKKTTMKKALGIFLIAFPFVVIPLVFAGNWVPVYVPLCFVGAMALTTFGFYLLQD